jgi:hypothetical protein
MLATPETLLAHEPPEVVLLRTATLPSQTCIEPVELVIGAGSWLTVRLAVAKQPPGSVYVIGDMPAIVALPVAIPVDALIVATPVTLLAHVPPDGKLLSGELAPWHTASAPVIGDGNELTVTTAVW